MNCIYSSSNRDGGDKLWLWSLSLINQRVLRLSICEGREGHSREEELEQSHGYITSSEEQRLYTKWQGQETRCGKVGSRGKVSKTFVAM